MKWKFISDPIYTYNEVHLWTSRLRFCKTAITWLRSLLAIFFVIVLTSWHRKTASHLLQRLEKCTMISRDTRRFPAEYGLRSTKCAVFTVFYNEIYTFSLLTWLGSPIFLFYLLVSQTNFLWSVFSEIWLSDFLLWWVIWFKSFHFVVICT